jgi:membrane fusion protein, multidrug efflux system
MNESPQTQPAPEAKPRPKTKTKSKKRVFKILLILVIGTVIYAVVAKNFEFISGFPIFKKDKVDVEKQSYTEVPLPVKAYRVSISDFTDTLPALGTIKGYREIDLKFAESGYVEYINFKDGEKVIEGDIIASLDQREALLKLEYAKNEVEKNQALFDLGSIIAMKLNQSKLEYQSARMDYEKTNLIAPFDGYVGSVEVGKGDFVTPSDILGSFVNLTDAYVEFGIIEKDVTKVRVGQPVSMSVDSYPQDTFEGEIESISPIVEGKSRTFKVKARITNEEEKLKAGMFGRVGVLIYEKSNTLIIPSASFKKKEEEYFVYVIHPELPEEEEEPSEEPEEEPSAEDEFAGEEEITFGSIEIRPIQIAYTTPDAVEIKAGLDEGELVVADIQHDFEEKARVEVTEVQENIF